MISAAPRAIELQKYELLEEIGHGGMATVYRARDRRLEREVAVKLIHRHLREIEEVETRFASEARVVAKLRHPNIVEVYDVSDEEDAERYLVVELVRGETLRHLLKRCSSLPVELAASIVLELAAALEHAHAEGVVHRDIKPENVLLETPVGALRDSFDDWDRPRVKLTDFGIAKLLDAQGVTSTGQVLGSPAHMAPEQIEGRHVDVRADVFSLGVLFYETVVGSLPFAGNNPAQVLRNVLDGRFRRPDAVRPEVGDCWSRVIQKALERDPEARFASIEEFASAIRGELKAVGFEHSRRDIADFLIDIEGYREQFVERVIGGLKASGVRERKAHNVPKAACQLARALAYKPGDAELLRLVSGLRRRLQLRKGALYACYGLIVLGLAGLTLVLWPRESPESPLPAPTSAKLEPLTSDPQPSAESNPVQTAPIRTVAPVASAPSARERPSDKVVRRAARAALAARATSPQEEQKRQVSVRVTGAAGGSVKIDGKERPWFGGIVHELAVGEHLFEFVPPNTTCCTPTTQRVAVTPGEQTMLVVGKIPFRDAILALRSPGSEGWVLSCPTLFPEELTLPGRRSVPMSELKVSGSCTLSNSAEGSATRRKVVTLQAGLTTALSWP